MGLIPDGLITQPFRPHYGPRVDSASNISEYQEYFLEGNDGRCIGLTILPSSCTDCLKMWQSEPSGTLRACNRPVQGLLCLFC